MQFHERAGEVETDACAYVAVVRVGRTLVEALEDGFQLIFGDADAAVLDADVGMVVGVGEREQDSLQLLMSILPRAKRLWNWR